MTLRITATGRTVSDEVSDHIFVSCDGNVSRWEVNEKVRKSDRSPVIDLRDFYHGGM